MKTTTVQKFLCIALFSFIFHSANAIDHTLNQSSGSITETGTSYVNDMLEVWYINIGVNKPIKFTYNIDTEDGSDFVEIYSIDTAGKVSDSPIAYYTGNQIGQVSTGVVSGRAKVVFYSDGGICNDEGYNGIQLSFSESNDMTLPDNLYVNGNLGIGTTTPKEKLEVNGNIRGNEAHGALSIKTDFGYIMMGPVNSSWAHFITDMPKFIFNKPIYAATGEISSYQGINLSLQTYGQTRMTILNNNGNVGIGTITPQAPLHVKASIPAGSFRISPSADNAESSMGFFSDAAGISTSTAWVMGNSCWGNTGKFIIGNQTAGGPIFSVQQDGNVGIGIGKANAVYKLEVKGTIHANEVIVDMNVPFADYVFNSNYKLMPLDQVEQYVNTNNHLPEMPSAAEVSKNGVKMGELQNKLLQKVEELTLYMIDQQKTINEQSAKIEELEKKLK